MSALFRGRDLLVLGLLLVTFYQYSFRFVPWSVHLEPSWFIEFARGGETEVKPPVLVDLDGDGSSEIVVLDRDGKIKAFRLASFEDRDSKSIYHPEEIFTVQDGVVGFNIRDGVILSVHQDLRIEGFSLRTNAVQWTVRPWANLSFSQVSVEISSDARLGFVAISLSNHLAYVCAVTLDHGALLWSRTVSAESEPQRWYSKDSYVPFTPDISSHPIATGTPPRYWHIYKESFLRMLPHSSDAFLVSLRHFHRHRARASQSAKTHRKKFLTGSKKAATLSQQGRKGNATAAASKTAAIAGAITTLREDLHNVVVVRAAFGLVALSIGDGATLSSLSLEHSPSADSASTLFADLNKDGMVESIGFHPLSEAQAGDWRRCKMIVLHGLPARAQLFEVDVCSSAAVSQSHKKADMSWSASGNGSAPFALAFPHQAEIVVATAEGMLSAWTSKGELRWKTASSPRWTKATNSRPSLTGFNVLADLSSQSDYSHFILAGTSRLGVYSMDGNQHATVEIPRPLLLPPLAADFNHDGLADLVITTGAEIIGLQLWYHSSEATIVAILAVAMGVALLALVLHVRFNRLDDSGHLAKLAQRWSFSIARSTDDHLD